MEKGFPVRVWLQNISSSFNHVWWSSCDPTKLKINEKKIENEIFAPFMLLYIIGTKKNFY